MAISSPNIPKVLDFLFKKFVAGKSYSALPKNYFEEATPSRPSVLKSDVWTDDVPLQNPLDFSFSDGAQSGSVEFVKDIEFSLIPGTFSFRSSSQRGRLIIPFSYGQGYEYRVKVSPTGREIVLGENNWFLDPDSGVLTFFDDTLSSDISGGKLYLSYFRYIGGFGDFSNSSAAGLIPIEETGIRPMDTWNGFSWQILTGHKLSFNPESQYLDVYINSLKENYKQTDEDPAVGFSLLGPDTTVNSGNPFSVQDWTGPLGRGFSLDFLDSLNSVLNEGNIIKVIADDSSEHYFNIVEKTDDGSNYYYRLSDISFDPIPGLTIEEAEVQIPIGSPAINFTWPIGEPSQTVWIMVNPNNLFYNLSSTDDSITVSYKVQS